MEMVRFGRRGSLWPMFGFAVLWAFLLWPVWLVIGAVLALSSLASAQEVQPDVDQVVSQYRERGLYIVDELQVRSRPVSVIDGQAYLLSVAAGHMNRIVTPFSNPEIWTSSSAQIERRENVLYVLPGGGEAIDLFITDKGDETVAMNVMLLPLDIPSVEVRLELAPRSSAKRLTALARKAEKEKKTRRKARETSSARWERSQPYVTTITEVLGTLMNGEVPSGYTKASFGDRPVGCHVPSDMNVVFEGGQRFVGGNFAVNIGRVENTGTARAFRHEWCSDPRVAAVSLFPYETIPAGAETEIFVVERLVAETGNEMRPSLIWTGN